MEGFTSGKALPDPARKPTAPGTVFPGGRKGGRKAIRPIRAWEQLRWRWSKDKKRMPKVIVSALRTDPGLGMVVKYFRPFIRPWVGANLCPLKVPVDASPGDRDHNPFVRRMPSVTSKSPHSRDTMGERAQYRSARERP
jgi:hypothetical protein